MKLDKYKILKCRVMVETKLFEPREIIKYYDLIILKEDSIPDWLADISICSSGIELINTFSRILDSGLRKYEMPKNYMELYIASAVFSNELKKLKLSELIKNINNELYYRNQNNLFEIECGKGKYLDKIKKLYSLESSKEEILFIFNEIKSAQQGDAPETGSSE